jgi:hypothetical protein
VAARRPRGVVSAAETGRALDAFRRAIETGDLQGLLDQLAPDVVLLGDGGGIRHAATPPVVGAGRVAALLAQGVRRLSGTASVELAQINGGPALIFRIDGELDGIVAVRVDEGLITGLYAVRNPEKLSRVQPETAVQLARNSSIASTTSAWSAS